MALLTYRAYGLAPPMQSDFDFVWIGLRAFVHGENPYRAVADAHVRGPLYYPMPALVALAPLGLRLGGRWRGSSSPGWGSRRWPTRPPAGRAGCSWRCSAPARSSRASGGQWSPLLTAGAAVPWLSALWVCKPGIGLALWCGYPSRWAVFGGLALLLLASS